MRNFLVAVIIMVASFAVKAATVSYSFGIPLTPTEISKTGSLGLFDSSLGTLTGVSLKLSSRALFSFSGINADDLQPRSATLTSFTDILWSSNNSTVGGEIVDMFLSASSGLVQFAANETRIFGPLHASDTDIYNSASLIGALQAVGGGDFTMTCESLTGMTVQGGGGYVAGVQATMAGCGAEILYTYRENQVPEPGTLLLACLALAGLAGYRRLRTG